MRSALKLFLFLSLQGTEGQVVETLVQLQGLEAQVANLESLASQAVLNHGQGLTVALDGA